MTKLDLVCIAIFVAVVTYELIIEPWIDSP